MPRLTDALRRLAERLQTSKRARFVAILILLIGLILFRDLAPNRYEIFSAELLLTYVIAVVGLAFLVSAGMLSLGHSALFGLGAYTVAITTTRYDWDFWLAAVAAVVITGCVGLVLGLPSLRLGLFAIAMVTLGYAIIFEQLASEMRWLTGGGDGIPGIEGPAGFQSLESYYWFVLALAVISVWIARNLMRSPLGMRFRAIEQQHVAAQSLGVNVFSTKLLAFFVSSAYAGLGGALYAPLIGFVAPDSFNINLAILFLLMVLIGGRGTLMGPIIGAVILYRLPILIQNLSSRPGEISQGVYGALLLLFVYVIPDGIMTAWNLLVTRRRKEQPESDAAGDIRTLVDAGPTGVVIASSDIEKKLGGVHALSGFALSAQPGRVRALIGPNGAGKTTALNVLSGLLSPDAGTVRLDDADITRMPAWRRAQYGLGRTFQTPMLFEKLTCRDNVMVALANHSKVGVLSYLIRLPGARSEEQALRARADQLLRAVGLGSRIHDPAADLPQGDRRRLEVARIAAMHPRAILLDEPAAGLNQREIFDLGAAIRTWRDADISIVLVEHQMQFVMEIADEITVLDFGEVIAEGRPEDVKADPRVIEAYLGSAAEPDEMRETRG